MDFISTYFDRDEFSGILYTISRTFCKEKKKRDRQTVLVQSIWQSFFGFRLLLCPDLFAPLFDCFSQSRATFVGEIWSAESPASQLDQVSKLEQSLIGDEDVVQP